MSIELVGSRDELQHDLVERYHSPQEALATDESVRQTLRDFLHHYVDSGERGSDRLPRIEGTNEAVDNPTFSHEMFTGYGGLGELVHIRVDPLLADAKDGYFVARGDLHTGDISEPKIRHVERFYDNSSGRQTIIYFEDPRCGSWPQEYQPMIHFVESTFRFTYKAGFGQGESLLRPIEPLVELLKPERTDITLQRTGPIGRGALELVRTVQ